MERSTVLQDISEQITCGICLERFKTPKTVIPCLHNFCGKCLQDTIEQLAHPKVDDSTESGITIFTFQCASCRGSVEFPVREQPPWNMEQIAKEAVTNEFKTNFQIENQLAIINKKIEKGCPQHQGEVQMWFCKMCLKVICQFCVQENHTPPEHEVTLLEGFLKEKRNKLSNHREAVSKAICDLKQVCTKIEHQLESIQGAKSKYQDQTQNITDGIIRICRQFEIVKDGLLKQNRDFDEDMNSQEMTILNIYQEVLQDVDDYQSKMKELDDKLAETDSELLSDSTVNDISADMQLPEPPTIPTIEIPESKELPLELLRQDLNDMRGIVKKIGEHLGVDIDEDESEASDTSVYYSEDGEDVAVGEGSNHDIKIRAKGQKKHTEGSKDDSCGENAHDREKGGYFEAMDEYEKYYNKQPSSTTMSACHQELQTFTTSLTRMGGGDSSGKLGIPTNGQTFLMQQSMLANQQTPFNAHVNQPMQLNLRQGFQQQPNIPTQSMNPQQMVYSQQPQYQGGYQQSQYAPIPTNQRGYSTSVPFIPYNQQQARYPSQPSHVVPGSQYGRPHPPSQYVTHPSHFDRYAPRQQMQPQYHQGLLQMPPYTQPSQSAGTTPYTQQYGQYPVYSTYQGPQQSSQNQPSTAPYTQQYPISTSNQVTLPTVTNTLGSGVPLQNPMITATQRPAQPSNQARNLMPGNQEDTDIDSLPRDELSAGENSEPLTAKMLEQFYSPSEQKQIIGERLYPIVHKMHGDLAGKITGMLLQTGDNEMLLGMLKSRDALIEYVAVCLEVLKKDKTKKKIKIKIVDPDDLPPP